jgi:hypothetical protein
MTIESQIAALTAATTDLLNEVVIKKDELRNNASAILYGGQYATIKDALDALLYVPLNITSYNLNTSTAEIGSTVSGLALTWAINKSPTTQNINGTTVAPSARTFSPSGSFTTNQTFTLTVGDGTNTTNASTSLSFLSKRYWGVSASTTLTDAQIIALGGSELTSSKSKTVTYDATGGRYPYYCYPAALGALTNVTVNNLSFSDYTVVTRAFVNASGSSVSYNIVRFNNIQNGSSIAVSWA